MSGRWWRHHQLATDHCLGYRQPERPRNVSSFYRRGNSLSYVIGPLTGGALSQKTSWRVSPNLLLTSWGRDCLHSGVSG